MHLTIYRRMTYDVTQMTRNGYRLSKEAFDDAVAQLVRACQVSPAL